MTIKFYENELIIGSSTIPENVTFRFSDILKLGGGGVSPTWQDIILSGNTALTLVNAKADGLNYLKLFGGTEQLSENYIDSVTLEGKCEQRNLPSGYTQLEYVYMTSGSFIKVEDLLISAGYRVEYDFQTTTLNSALRNYLGGRAGGVSAGGGFRLTKLASNNNNRVVLYGFKAGTEYYDPTTQFQPDTRYKYTYNNGVCTLESGGSVVSTQTFTVTDDTSTKWGINAYVNGNDWQTSTDGIYVYALKVWNPQGELVMNLVPAKTSTAIGFYDMVTGNLREASVGSFEAGGDATPTPDNPMDIVSNNGVLKVNRLDLNNCDTGHYYDASGNYISTNVARLSNKIAVKAGDVIDVITTIISGSGQLNIRYNQFNTNDVWVLQTVYAQPAGTTHTETITIQQDGFFSFSGNYTSTTSSHVDWDTVVIINKSNPIYTDGTQEVVTDSLGNTATAQMLLSVGNYKDTQEVLTGAVTRNVGIKVLDGTENWSTTTLTNCYSLADDLGIGNFTDRTVFCTHFKNSADLPASGDRQGYALIGNNGTKYTVGFGATTQFPTVAQFKQWLADQYNAGTPVIIVYPTSSATTETVTPQILQKEPVTVTGSLTGLVANVVSSSHTTPTPIQPLPINSNNGVLKIQGSATGTVTQDSDPTPTEPIYPVFYQKGNLVLRAVDGYADAYDATTQTITRNIGVRIFDGTENFQTISTPNVFRFGFIGLDRGAAVSPMCSHYPAATITLSTANMPDKTIKGNATTANNYYIKDSRFSTEDELKAWLADQYNAGKPVTIYYVLEAPITESFTPSVYTDGTVETVEVTGKNLYNSAIKTTGYYISATGVITAEPNSAYSALIPVLPNTTYILSGYTFSNSSNKRLHAYDKEGNWISQINYVTVSGQGEYSVYGITPANCRYIRISIINSDSNVQLEQGSTKTEYEPYFNGGTATAEMLLKVGNYQDEQSVLDGQVTRKVGIKVLNGTENWVKGTSFYADISLNALQSVHSCICNYYAGKSTDSYSADRNTIQVGYSVGGLTFWNRVYITANRAEYATANDFKAFLADQYANGTPVIIVYPLATPTTETITAQPLTIQAGTNVVEITQASMDNLGLEVSYKAGVTVTVTEVQNAQLDNSVTVTIGE